MNRVNRSGRSGIGLLVLGLLALALVERADAATFIEGGSSPYGTFAGIDYLRFTGTFVGTTAKGEYRVPYEIVAPADSRQGNGVVVFEPPHFIFGTGGRNSTLGPEMLFNRRFSHASVGFSNDGFNLLDVTAMDAMIAGQPVRAFEAPLLRDVEILKQFVESLDEVSMTGDALGPPKHVYAYGVSQTAEALYEVFYGPGGAGLFDLTVLHVPLWRPPFARPDVLAALPDDFTPLPDVGKVMLVSAEGDLLISQSIELRNAVSDPNYRLYEIAGAPHLADDMPVAPNIRTNPLELAPVVRAAFRAGDRWVRRHVSPPENSVLASAAPGEIDPFYGTETGIARDANGNAVGGVQFPDVATGRAFHLAAALDIAVGPGLFGLIGLWSDLACLPAPGSGSAEPRFGSHPEYVVAVLEQTLMLVAQGYLLPADETRIVQDAAASGVGEPGSCGGS